MARKIAEEMPAAPKTCLHAKARTGIKFSGVMTRCLIPSYTGPRTVETGRQQHAMERLLLSKVKQAGNCVSIASLALSSSLQTKTRQKSSDSLQIPNS